MLHNVQETERREAVRSIRVRGIRNLVSSPIAQQAVILFGEQAA